MKYIAFIVIIVGLKSCNEKLPIKTNLENKPFPEFSLLLTDSTTYLNTKTIQAGKPIVLFDFGPNCPYSHAQMEEIVKTIDMLKDIQFYIFTPWPFHEMKNFYTHYELNKYSNIIVGVDYTNFFVTYYNIPGVPYTAIYGKNKRLNHVFVGKVYGRQIKEAAEK